jgi:AraC-like DNA-binding protein
MKAYNSISDFHRHLGLPKPLNPLISVVNMKDINVPQGEPSEKFIINFYKISFIESSNGRVSYGQNYFDFDEGGLFFISPGQIISPACPSDSLSGTTIYMHPDLIRVHNLGKKIKNYGFFSYSVAEALHLSEKEKVIVLGLFKQIELELNAAIDTFSQDLLTSYVELLLDYSNRFYTRQFITRKTANNDLLTKLEALLDDYFNNDKAIQSGLPTVQYVSEQLHFSPDYLSDMLRAYTGQNTQQHIHNKLIDTAKMLLSSSNLTVAEVAYQLGFEHPQSFNKLFKRKTNISPTSYRHSFN